VNTAGSAVLPEVWVQPPAGMSGCQRLPVGVPHNRGGRKQAITRSRRADAACHLSSVRASLTVMSLNPSSFGWLLPPDRTRRGHQRRRSGHAAPVRRTFCGHPDLLHAEDHRRAAGWFASTGLAWGRPPGSSSPAVVVACRQAPRSGWTAPRRLLRWSCWPGYAGGRRTGVAATRRQIAAALSEGGHPRMAGRPSAELRAGLHFAVLALVLPSAGSEFRTIGRAQPRAPVVVVLIFSGRTTPITWPEIVGASRGTSRGPSVASRRRRSPELLAAAGAPRLAGRSGSRSMAASTDAHPRILVVSILNRQVAGWYRRWRRPWWPGSRW
jgi:hypothetical protein